MRRRMARTGKFSSFLIFTVLFSTAFAADPDTVFGTVSGDQPAPSARWSANGGSTSFDFITNLLEELDISVYGPPRPAGSVMPGQVEFAVRTEETLELWAPHAAWDGFASGELHHSGRLTLDWPGGRLDLDGFSLKATSPETLHLVDASGNRLFRLDHIHTMLYPEKQEMTLRNMDLSLTPWLANKMGYPDLAGMVIAVAYTHTSLEIPAGAEIEGACTSPNWHDGVNFFTDVELVSMSSVQQVARQAGVRVAIAPSATLRNAGSADVPWYWKFDTPVGGTYPPPYDRDQHPFLVWAMYRIVDDIPQQIGQSAVKHAFFTVNSTCSCSGGHILWAAQSSPNGLACTDTYSVGNNNDPTHLGIRDEVPAFTAEWEQCGSMFAPGASPPGPCNQTVSGDTADSFERRLVVQESELQTENATYYFEGWYVIRDDIDIFNTMAHKSLTPTFGSTWTFPAGAHTMGPALDSWVPPNTLGATQAHARKLTSQGHYSMAVKVTDLGAGNYRYVYALMNYDFDPKFDSFRMPLPEGVTVGNIQFLDGDDAEANDWASDTNNGYLTFAAPPDAALEWGHMATFVFEANQAPVQGLVELTAEEMALSTRPLILALADILHQEGFEN